MFSRALRTKNGQSMIRFFQKRSFGGAADHHGPVQSEYYLENSARFASIEQKYEPKSALSPLGWKYFALGGIPLFCIGAYYMGYDANKFHKEEELTNTYLIQKGYLHQNGQVVKPSLLDY